MNDLSRAGKTLIIVFVTVFLLGSVVKLLERPRIVYVQDPNIPSVREIQQRLKDFDDPRYDCEVDGIIGPQTRKAWDAYECDKQAKKCFE